MNPFALKWHLLMLLLVSFFSRRASAQTYRLRSLEGDTVSVRVFRESILSDGPQHRRDLSIVCGTDTVFVYDAWDNGTAKVLNQQFLQLTYAVRGGTNQGLGSTLVLCVAHGKLCQALKVPSYSQGDLYGADYYHERYRVRLNLRGTTPPTYRFRLTAHDEQHSSFDRANDHRFTTQTVAAFDPDRHLFYTGFRQLPARFAVVDDKTGQVVTLNVPKPVPVLELKDRVQYFIQGEWYGAARIE